MECDWNALGSGITVLRGNRTVSHRTLKGDVYVGPNAVVVMNDVVIEGILYVLGKARLQNVTADMVSCRKRVEKGEKLDFSDGTVYLGVENHIQGYNCSPFPVTEIPYDIKNKPICSIDGMLSLRGRTLDIAHFYVNHILTELQGDGSFFIKDIPIGCAKKLQLKWVTVFQNVITQELDVERIVLSGIDFHCWDTDYTVDWRPTCQFTGMQSIHCSVCGEKKPGSEREIPAKEGFVFENGECLYYRDGKAQEGFSGMKKVDGTWCYITGGKWNRTYTGLVKNEYGWWYMADGKLNFKYTGLAKNQYGWWYVKNGKIDKAYAGVVKNAGGSWYIKGGKMQEDYSGNIELAGKIYTIKNGKVV